MRGLLSGLLAVSLLVGGLVVPAPRSRAGTWTCGASTYASDPLFESIANGGFEGGMANWYIPSPDTLPAINTTVFHSGARSAWVHSYGSHEDAAQDLPVSVPPAYALSYWFYVGRWESGGTFALELMNNWDVSMGTANAVSTLTWIPPNTMRWAVWTLSGGTPTSRDYARWLNAGVWHSVVTVVDGPAGRQCLYIDGAYVDALTVAPASTFQPDVLAFGDISWAGNACDGLWDDISIQALGPASPLQSENWKPILALVFTVILALVAAVLGSEARRQSWPRWRPILLGGVVFAVAEGVTGILSAFLGVLSIPPLLGLGTAVDAALLAAGLAVLAALFLRARPRPMPPQPLTVPEWTGQGVPPQPPP